jgi:hypothetical protein
MSAPARRRPLLPGPDQVVLRSLVVAGVLLALLAAQLAGARPPDWLQVAVTLLAVLGALRPESIAGVLAPCGVCVVWALGPDPLSPLLLAVAAGLVVAHVGALVAAQGPALARVDPAQARRWLVRGVGLWLAALVVWGLDLLVEDHPGGRRTYAVGLLLLAAAAVMGTREVGKRVG